MATRATTKPGEPMAVITVGYTDVLLPMSKATKVMELLSTGVEVDDAYEQRERVYTVKGKLRMSMTLIDQRQVRMPEGTPVEPAPIRRLSRS